MSFERQRAEIKEFGWTRFDHDPALFAWCKTARPAAMAAIASPEQAHWLRCGGTWFAGVNALSNDSAGALANDEPLRGQAIEFLSAAFGPITWDRAQISVTYPGYPVQEHESDAAFGYRLKRDAAHIDGLIRDGPDIRRFAREYHAFILGIPLTETGAGASPLAIWTGSHCLAQPVLQRALGCSDPADWPAIDLTDAYQAVRRDIFDRCDRMLLHARLGEAYVVHRHALHGISPWKGGAKAPPEGRVIAYFRPDQPDPLAWLAKS